MSCWTRQWRPDAITKKSKHFDCVAARPRCGLAGPAEVGEQRRTMPHDPRRRKPQERKRSRSRQCLRKPAAGGGESACVPDARRQHPVATKPPPAPSCTRVRVPPRPSAKLTPSVPGRCVASGWTQQQARPGAVLPARAVHPFFLYAPFCDSRSCPVELEVLGYTVAYQKRVCAGHHTDSVRAGRLAGTSSSHLASARLRDLNVDLGRQHERRTEVIARGLAP